MDDDVVGRYVALFDLDDDTAHVPDASGVASVSELLDDLDTSDVPVAPGVPVSDDLSSLFDLDETPGQGSGCSQVVGPILDGVSRRSKAWQSIIARWRWSKSKPKTDAQAKYSKLAAAWNLVPRRYSSLPPVGRY
jgi:hypothetical protein